MTCVVTKNAEAARYELRLDGEVVGIADYVEQGETVVLPHTVIDGARRGHGLGAVLVRGVLDDVRPTGRKVIPSCWYVAQFIDENPSYKDLLATS